MNFESKVCFYHHWLYLCNRKISMLSPQLATLKVTVDFFNSDSPSPTHIVLLSILQQNKNKCVYSLFLLLLSDARKSHTHTHI
jgi:hypothetical protein